MTSSSGGNPFRAILDVGSALVSSVALDEVFANVARTIGEAMMASEVEIHSFDQKRNAFFLEARWSMTDDPARVAPAQRVPVPVAERPDLRKVTARQELLERRIDGGLSSEERGELVASGRKSVLSAPLRVGREVLGVLSLIETRFPRRYAPMEQDLLVQLCGLAAISIRNAHLLRERDERALHMQLLLDVGHAVTSSLVLDDVLKAVCQYIGQAMEVFSCDIQLYDAEHDKLIYAACWDKDPSSLVTLLGVVIDPDERPSNRLALEGKPVECHLDDPDLPTAERAELERWGEKTTLDFPLVYQDEIMGVLGLIEREHVRHFTFEERSLFEQLGTLASIAIRNAQVVRRLEQQSQHLASLRAITRAWDGIATIDELFGLIAREAAASFAVSRVLLFQYERDAREADEVVLRGAFPEVPAAGHPPVGSRLPVGDVSACERAQSGAGPLLERVSDLGLEQSIRDELRHFGERSRLVLPLRLRGETLGVLIIIDTDSERLFGDAELELAASIGTQAAVALAAAAVIDGRWPALAGETG